MTPDLTLDQFITLATTLASTVLTAFFTMLIVFTYQEQIQHFLVR